MDRSLTCPSYGGSSHYKLHSDIHCARIFCMSHLDPWNMRPNYFAHGMRVNLKGEAHLILSIIACQFSGTSLGKLVGRPDFVPACNTFLLKLGEATLAIFLDMRGPENDSFNLISMNRVLLFIQQFREMKKMKPY